MGVERRRFNSGSKLGNGDYMLVGLLQDGRVRHTPVLCKRIRSVLFLDAYADFRDRGSVPVQNVIPG